MVRWLVAATIAAAPPVAPTPPALTLDNIFKLPIPEAAAIALPENHPDFVERSPWSDITPNYVMNTITLFGLSFYGKPQRLSDNLCVVTRGHITFDTKTNMIMGGRGPLPLGQRPLERKGALISRVYFAPGPALPVPLLPGQQPAPLSPSAGAADSCDNPVSGRKTFDAASDTDAIRLINLFEAARKQATKAAITCTENGRPCSSPARELASLNPQSLFQCYPNRCFYLKEKENCSSFEIDPTYSLGIPSEWWTIEVASDDHGNVTDVRMALQAPPVI